VSLLVTGGAGFIGSNFVLDWLNESDEQVINLDKLTYAGNLENLTSLRSNQRHIFRHGDIKDAILVSALIEEYKPRAIINFAAESHVDRSFTMLNTVILGMSKKTLHSTVYRKPVILAFSALILLC
jgi:dTDP-glucose 4,6-dehydratase